MDTLSILCILVGALFIAVRGPLIFAPRATLRFYERFIATKAGIRGTGLVMAPLALALVVLARGDGAVGRILEILGWLFVVTTLWLLAAPASYQRFARSVLDFFETSVDLAIVRILGLFAVAIGGGLIYVGLAARIAAE